MADHAFLARAPVAFPFVGGVLCLDFLNTVVAHRDLLTDFTSFARWLAEAGLLTAEQSRSLLQHWGTGRRASAALAQVKALRENFRTAVTTFASGRPVPTAILKAINEQLIRSQPSAELVAEADGQIRKSFRLRWQETADLLAPLTASVADLLTSADRSLIHQCAGPDCTLFFYDRTKNHRRRWCSVTACGNRAKVAAFRARQGQAA